MAGLGLDKHSGMQEPWKYKVLELDTPKYCGGKDPASGTGGSPVGQPSNPRGGSFVAILMQ